MTLPPLPGPDGIPDTIYRWLTRVKSSLDDALKRLTTLETETTEFPEGVSPEELDARLAELEGNTGTVQRYRVEHNSYPADTFISGASIASPATLATATFTPVGLGNVLWVTGQVVHSTGSDGPDANGCETSLYINGVEVDSRRSHIGQNSYDTAGVFLFWEIDTVDPVEIKIKAGSTRSGAAGTRFRAPGTYFIFEEIKQ